MSSRDESIPSPVPAPDMFRRVVLWRLRNPEHLCALEWMGELFHDWLSEGNQLGQPDGESFTLQALRGAVEDLEAVALHLEYVAGHYEECILNNEDAVLCAKARKWSQKVRELAAKVDSRLGPAPSDEVSAA